MALPPHIDLIFYHFALQLSSCIEDALKHLFLKNKGNSSSHSLKIKNRTRIM